MTWTATRVLRLGLPSTLLPGHHSRSVRYRRIRDESGAGHQRPPKASNQRVFFPTGCRRASARWSRRRGSAYASCCGRNQQHRRVAYASHGGGTIQRTCNRYCNDFYKSYTRSCAVVTVATPLLLVRLLPKHRPHELPLLHCFR